MGLFSSDKKKKRDEEHKKFAGLVSQSDFNKKYMSDVAKTMGRDSRREKMWRRRKEEDNE